MGHYSYGYFFDPTYILVLVGAIITIIAQIRVTSTFKKYSKIKSKGNITGHDMARNMLGVAGISDVRIVKISGELTDNYNPKTKTISLSDSVYNNTSVAAIGVAAHECGHAIQHKEGYIPIKIRSSIYPVVNIGSTLSWPIIIIGIIFSYNQVLINIGIIMFLSVVVFQLVTLPVEFNASKRALRAMDSFNMLHEKETKGAKKVLKAAAMTYVAATAATLLQLLRLVLLFGRKRN